MKKTIKIPTDLKHRPFFVCEGYNNIDGHYNIGDFDSDAMGLSLGFAQWNDYEEDLIELSAKVWRVSDQESKDSNKRKWSRQSEELPLHRVLDLSILIASSLKCIEEKKCDKIVKEMEAERIEKKASEIGKKAPIEITETNLVFKTIDLSDGAEEDSPKMVLSLGDNEKVTTKKLKLIKRILGEDKEMLVKRLTILASLLEELEELGYYKTEK